MLTGAYHIDHFLPHAHHPHLTLDYDNLLYCCNACNLAKGDDSVPNPENAFIDATVNVYENGSIEATTSEAKRIIRQLGLDSLDYNDFRMHFIGIIQLANQYDSDLYASLMGYPDPLPNLAAKKPATNSRIAGIQQSCLAKRERGELPNVYV